MIHSELTEVKIVSLFQVPVIHVDTGLDDKSERFSWFFDDKMKNMLQIFTKIYT